MRVAFGLDGERLRTSLKRRPFNGNVNAPDCVLNWIFIYKTASEQRDDTL